VQGYQIFDRLGEGSMGVVYTAQRTDTGELCVLKLIEFTGSAKDAIFFIREAQAGSRIKHPNVVETMDFGESNGFLYLAMEFIEGGSLLDRIKRGGPLTNREALDQLRQVADALAFAFKKKIVHRDIKPANILLTKDGRPKLADFGLAKTMQAAGSKGLTQMGEARGTPIYMPPEQLTTAADADQRSDIYSLGATYYHALSGHHPFRAPTVPEILRMVVTQPPVPIRDRNPTAHPAICATIERMMRKDPNDRYQTPEELAAALEPLVNVVT
jgi:serine/threonine-protein kinase